MIPLLRRRVVCKTCSIVKRDLVCGRLDTIDVPYDAKIKNVSYRRFWRKEKYKLLLKMKVLYEYKIYVDKKDLSRAKIMLRD